MGTHWLGNQPLPRLQGSPGRLQRLGRYSWVHIHIAFLLWDAAAGCAPLTGDPRCAPHAPIGGVSYSPVRTSDVGALPHRNRVGRNDNPPPCPARRQSPCSRAARLSSVPAALHAAPGVALFRCLLRWRASVLLVPRGGCHGRPPLSPRRRPPYPFPAGRVFCPERACGRGRPSSSSPLPVSSLDRTFPVGLPPPPTFLCFLSCGTGGLGCRPWRRRRGLQWSYWTMGRKRRLG